MGSDTKEPKEDVVQGLVALSKLGSTTGQVAHVAGWETVEEEEEVVLEERVLEVLITIEEDEVGIKELELLLVVDGTTELELLLDQMKLLLVLLVVDEGVIVVVNPKDEEELEVDTEGPKLLLDEEDDDVVWLVVDVQATVGVVVLSATSVR